MACIVEFEANSTGPSFVRAHKQQMHIWTKLEKQYGLGAADLGDYSCVENDLIILALKLGFQEAQEMCTGLGTKPDVVTKIVVGGWSHAYMKKSFEAHLFWKYGERMTCAIMITH